MVEPIGDWPDFTRAILIVGKDAAGNPVGVFVDSMGFLAAILKGQKPDATLATVALDASGRIIMVPNGTTEISGTATVTQAAKDREVQGADGATLRTLAVDASGQLIMVPRGQSGNYMAIDAAGFMTAVLKGAHDSVLTTIGVDANGRIDAFLMDGSDQWGKTIRVGNADLAGRMGSPVTYDWRGQVVWQTTFADGAGNLIPLYSGTGAFIGCVPDYSLMGGYSLKLMGGSTSDRYAQFVGYIGRQPSRRVGLCIAFSNYAETTTITIRVRDGGRRYYGSIRYVWSTTDLQYLGDDAAWHKFGEQLFFVTPPVFNFIKVVIDGIAHKYVRCLCNTFEYDLSAYALESDVIGVDGTMEYDVKTISRAGYNDYNLIDRVIVTSNEP